ncbi:hypothetical protein [Polynucleobacter sp. MWH-Braz-FAM2G]|uniref:hypothetical protein n=1 Tax=Polynucleobacter sp. MWH-Braz-FAM2G TaxID=1855883 RepID=UPI001BFDE2B7|nr:hypothetical protein [Polynucleobacter sp. MWH-Braz-FAM2G]QWD91062.1 hypothetical protein FD973_01605 [Polynucleobacter sp. MWH-Braz-FAM2G]
MKAVISNCVIISFLLLIGAGLMACESMPTQNQDSAKNNKATYNKDLKECKEDYPELGSGLHIRQWINCMNLKGWK